MCPHKEISWLGLPWQMLSHYHHFPASPGPALGNQSRAFWAEMARQTPTNQLNNKGDQHSQLGALLHWEWDSKATVRLTIQQVTFGMCLQVNDFCLKWHARGNSVSLWKTKICIHTWNFHCIDFRIPISTYTYLYHFVFSVLFFVSCM